MMNVWLACDVQEAGRALVVALFQQLWLSEHLRRIAATSLFGALAGSSTGTLPMASSSSPARARSPGPAAATTQAGPGKLEEPDDAAGPSPSQLELELELEVTRAYIRVSY